MVTLFLVAAVAGFLFLLVTLVFGELDLGDVDGIPWLSLPAGAAAVASFGAMGLATYIASGHRAQLALLVGIGIGALSYVAIMLVLRALKRSQSGTVQAGAKAIGTIATVSLAIPPGGWGQVTFVESDGVRATRKAQLTSTTASAAVGTSVLIIAAEPEHLIVDALALPAT